MSAGTGRTLRRSLVADRGGTAAVEFALLFPIMLVLFIGCYEVENVLMADLKLTAAAETAADLVAQTTLTGGSAGTGVLQSQDFTTFTSAAANVLTPLPTGTNNGSVKIAFASVTYSTGTPVIDWHVEENNATAISLSNIPNSQALTSLGNAAVNSPDSVIIVQVQYTYTSPISYVLNSSYTLSESAFNRPRYVTCVPTNPASVGGTHSNDTNGVCP
jgi:Flp pilus assembly protein TadG